MDTSLAFNTYEQYIESQARIIGLYAMHCGMGTEVVNGEWSTIYVDGIAMVKERMNVDEAVMLDIPKYNRPYFAGFSKAANQWHNERVKAKRIQKKYDRSELLSILSA